MVDPTTYTVTLTFEAPQAGTVVLNGSVYAIGGNERLLLASMQGTSLAPEALVLTQRRLASALMGTSTTPASGTAVQRPLTASLTAASSTPTDVAIVVSGLRALTATLLATSLTPASTVTQARTLQCAARHEYHTTRQCCSAAPLDGCSGGK